MNSFWRVSAACMVQTGNILPIEMHMFQSCTACNKKTLKILLRTQEQLDNGLHQNLSGFIKIFRPSEIITT